MDMMVKNQSIPKALTYLNAGFVMLFRGKKKGSIEKWVSVKDVQHGLAKNTWYPVHFVGSIT